MAPSITHGATNIKNPTVLTAIFASKRIRLVTGFVLFTLCLFYLFKPDVPDWRPLADKLTTTPYYNEPSVPSVPSTPTSDATIDWSRFAYGQYVTDALYLCNSVMFFAKLHELGSKADRIMMYPRDMLPDPETAESTDRSARLLIHARDEYSVKLAPITVAKKHGADSTWAESYTKLLVFNQTQYDRVLAMDSDSTILQSMDELFLLPPAPIALPRAYWIWKKEHTLSSQIILVQPSHEEFARVQKKIDDADSSEYDMEILNQLYGDSAMILPHRPYNILTGEFRSKNHTNYLGNDEEAWDPVAVYNEAKFLHFSDYPVSKPWLKISDREMRENEPDCEVDDDGEEDCTSRELWNGFYSDFKARQKVRFAEYS